MACATYLLCAAAVQGWVGCVVARRGPADYIRRYLFPPFRSSPHGTHSSHQSTTLAGRQVKGMATTGDGARRFMHALTAMLLVACSFPCAVGDGSSAAAVQQKAKALRDAVEGNNRAPPAAEPVVVAPERDSPGSLLERGTALLYEGNSKDAVAALDAAITGWEEEVQHAQGPVET